MLNDYNCSIKRHFRGSDFEFIEDLHFIPTNCRVIVTTVQLVGIKYKLIRLLHGICTGLILNLMKTFLLNLPQRTKETKKILSQNGCSLLTADNV
jgi:hypothetical protein